MQTEIWKDILGYEGMYQISNCGRVKSNERMVNNKLIPKTNERILKPSLNNGGYAFVRLCKDGKHKNYMVHRLVAQAFIPNLNNLPQVNHKDECKTNNTVENLEWCDSTYNNNYGTHYERSSKTLTNRSDLSKKVLCVELNKVFPSVREAARFIDNKTYLSKRVLIGYCCNNYKKYSTAYGYHWRYISD